MGGEESHLGDMPTLFMLVVVRYEQYRACMTYFVGPRFENVLHSNKPMQAATSIFKLVAEINSI